MGLKPEQMDTLALTNTICTSLSIVGALFVLGHHLIVKLPQTLVSRILVYMSLADLFTSTFKAIPLKVAKDVPGLCSTQAFFVQFGNLSHILWSLMLSIYLFFLFYKRWTMAQLDKWQRYDWIFCILFPFIVAICPLFTLASDSPVYGATSLWCWVRADYKEVQLAIHFIPLWITFLYTLFNYSMIGKRIWTYRYSDFDKMTAYSKYSFSRAATLCIILFLITWIPSTTNRVYTMIHKSEFYELNMYQAIFSGLRGFNYFLLYLFFQLTVVIRKKNNPDGVSMADNGFVNNRGDKNSTPLNIFSNKDIDTDSLHIFVPEHTSPNNNSVHLQVEHPSQGNSISSISTLGRSFVHS